MRVCVISMTMESNKIKDAIIERYADSDDILFADGLDNAIVGFDPNNWKVVYSRSICISILCEDMSEEEAIDHLEYNTFNAYVGKNTPLWIDDFGWY